MKRLRTLLLISLTAILSSCAGQKTLTLTETSIYDVRVEMTDKIRPVTCRYSAEPRETPRLIPRETVRTETANSEVVSCTYISDFKKVALVLEDGESIIIDPSDPLMSSGCPVGVDIIYSYNVSETVIDSVWWDYTRTRVYNGDTISTDTLETIESYPIKYKMDSVPVYGYRDSTDTVIVFMMSPEDSSTVMIVNRYQVPDTTYKTEMSVHDSFWHSLHRDGEAEVTEFCTFRTKDTVTDYRFTYTNLKALQRFTDVFGYYLEVWSAEDEKVYLLKISADLYYYCSSVPEYPYRRSIDDAGWLNKKVTDQFTDSKRVTIVRKSVSEYRHYEN